MKTIKVKKYNNLKQKIKGLIGEKKSFPLYFETRFGIHTFSLSFPLDVVILDSQNRVVAIKKSLQPSKIFFWNPRFYKVLELPAGMIEKEKIEIGEKIKLEFY